MINLTLFIIDIRIGHGNAHSGSECFHKTAQSKLRNKHQAHFMMMKMIMMLMMMLMTGDTPECQAATQLFITNGANLMNSIKEVIKASKSAHALPHNKLTTGTLCVTLFQHNK